MGLDIFALVTQWEPAVTACRAAGGLDFYWDANVARNDRFGTDEDGDDLPELPFLTEVELPSGRSSYLSAGEYYDFLRPHLPVALRDAGDATYGLLLPHLDPDWVPARRDDLGADAGTGTDGNVLYALRPASVRAVLAGAPPWPELLAVAEQHDFEPGPGPRPDYFRYVNADTFEMAAQAHLGVLASAAANGRGVITVISY